MEQLDRALGDLRRLDDCALIDAIRRRDRAEGALDLGLHRVGIERSRDDYHGVVRRVEATVIAVKIFPAHRLEIVFRADHEFAIAVRAEGGGKRLVPQHVGRIVEGALTFGEDDGPLRFGLGRVNQQVDHAIGFEADGQSDPIRRQGLMVRGVVVRREGVQLSAVPVHAQHQLAGADIRRPLEHHVFNPMRDAGNSRQLITGANTIKDPKRGDWRIETRIQQNLEAIAKGRSSKILNICHWTLPGLLMRPCGGAASPHPGRWFIATISAQGPGNDKAGDGLAAGAGRGSDLSGAGLRSRAG